MDTKKFGLAATIFLALFLFWGGSQLARQQRHEPLESDSFLNYVIPKLKKFVPKLSLWGRKFIDRRKLAPSGPPMPPKKQANATPSPSPTPTPKAQAKVTATPTPTPGVGASMSYNPSVVSSDKNDDFANDSDITGSGNANAGRPLAHESPSPETQIGEWRMRILRSPTKETMNEFVFAFQTGKVTKEVFYQVIDELLRDSSPEIQRLAVYAVSGTPSLESFSIYAMNKDHLSSETFDMQRVMLEGYTRPDKLKILELAIKSNNATVALAAMPLIVKISKKLTLWSADYSSTSNDRSRRGPSTRVPKNDFVQVVEALTSLAEGSDRQLAQAARETLNNLNYRPTTAFRRE